MSAVPLARALLPSTAAARGAGRRAAPAAAARSAPGPASQRRRAGRARAEGAGGGGSDKEGSAEPGGLADMLDMTAAARELLNDPATMEQVRSMAAAAGRVAAAQAAQADLARAIAAQEAVDEGAQAAAQQAADARVAALGRGIDEIQSAQKVLESAAAEVRAAQAARDALGGGGGSSGRWSDATGAVDEDAERAESAKAGAAAAVGGLAASMPFVLAAADPLLGPPLGLSLGAVAASCGLFGVTYRYAVRSDVDNKQLKSGVFAAFGLARGLALLEAAVAAGGPEGGLEAWASGALQAGEAVIGFAFAAAALELAFRAGAVRPFPLGGRRPE